VDASRARGTDNVSMPVTVWVDDWQQQCCGAPFAVGGTVHWTLTGPDTAWLATVLGPERAAAVDRAEEHHGRLPDDAPVTTGTVTSIGAVHCRFRPLPGGNRRDRYPDAGTTTVTRRDSADGWEPADADLRFVGYLVEIADDRADRVDRVDRAD
jgi:hypothetical protein